MGVCAASGARAEAGNGAVSGDMAELYGRYTGYCKGKGGSMHVTDGSRGVLGANGIVGAGYLLAMGAGITIKHQKRDDISVVIAGDGSVNFADETLHLRLVSRSKSFSLASLRGPILVTGTFMRPKVKPDTKKVAARGAAVWTVNAVRPAAVFDVLPG